MYEIVRCLDTKVISLGQVAIAQRKALMEAMEVLCCT